MFVANLEVFGFAVSEALHDAKSENVGLRDQRLALQCKLIFLWGIMIFGLRTLLGVKDNIAAFGGAPDNITAFGQSAGSINTNFQLLAFGGKQGAVFQKAMYVKMSISLLRCLANRPKHGFWIQYCWRLVGRHSIQRYC